MTRVERAYRWLVEVGRALLSAPGEAELAAQICDIAVRVAGYRMAWVGYREDDARATVRVVASAGFDAGYLEQAAISWANDERGSGPSGTAIRSGRPAVANNIAHDPRFAPWRADAMTRGYASSAALPMGEGTPAWGVLNVYAPEPDAFDGQELDLLMMVAADLAYGIEAARGKRELARLQAGLHRQERDRMASHASALLAHDMNNYLGVLATCIDGIAQRCTDVAAEDLADARKALQHAVALNRKVLQTAYGMGADIVSTTPDAVIPTLVPELQRLLRPGCTLQVDLAARGARTRIEAEGLQQALYNLVVNAADATDHGSILISTTVLHLEHPLPARWLGAKPGHYVSIRVRDQGVGIPADVLPHIFTPFFTTKGERGTGLGLASVHGIISRAHGFIAIDSASGRGTSIEMLLPKDND